MIRASERWRSIRITSFEHRQLSAVREELDREYENENGLGKPDRDERTPSAIPSRI